jgi:hypothetical protein
MKVLAALMLMVNFLSFLAELWEASVDWQCALRFA